jgi:hypothetical protein
MGGSWPKSLEIPIESTLFADCSGPAIAQSSGVVFRGDSPEQGECGWWKMLQYEENCR